MSNKRVLSAIERRLKDKNRSKKYSRSLSATNKLFAPHYLFRKPSRRRIYNPNAKYFHQGGNIPSHNHPHGDPPTQADSLNVYNQAVKLKNFYEGLLGTELALDTNSGLTLSEFADDMNKPGYSYIVRQAHLDHPNVSRANKAIIRGNTDPNVSYLSDIITGAIDPRAPLAIYDKRIKPQAIRTYEPLFDFLEDELYDELMAVDHKETEVFLNTGKVPSRNAKDLSLMIEKLMDDYYDNNSYVGEDRYEDLISIYETVRDKAKGSNKDLLDKYIKKLKKIPFDAAPGAYTQIPYYDPIMVKPWSMLTEAEKEYRRNYIQGSSFINKPKGTLDPKKSVNVNLIKLGLAKDTKSANVVKKELFAELFPDEKYKGSAAQNTKLNKFIFDNELDKEDITEILLEDKPVLDYEGTLTPDKVPEELMDVYDSTPWAIQKPEDLEIDRLPVIPIVTPEMAIAEMYNLPEELEEGNEDIEYRRFPTRHVEKIKEGKITKKGKFKRNIFGKRKTKTHRNVEWIYEPKKKKKKDKFEYPKDFVPRFFKHGGPHDPPKVKQRRGVRENPDGTVSSHLMRTEYIPERGWVAFPSLFQDSKPYADDSRNWVDMSEEEDWMKIYEEAERRGEVYDFGEDKEAALDFGEGSWKDQLPDEYIEAELSDEEVEQYRAGGYVLEELKDGGGKEKRKLRRLNRRAKRNYKEGDNWSSVTAEIVQPGQEGFDINPTPSPQALIKRFPECPSFHRYDTSLEECVPMTEEEKLEASRAAQSEYFDEAKQWVTDWHNSPMYNQMVLNSYNGNQANADYLTKLRKKNIETIPELNVEHHTDEDGNSNLPKGTNPAGQSHNDTGQIDVFPEGYTYGPSLYIHETMHSSDRPRELYKWNHPSYKKGNKVDYPDWMKYKDPRFPDETVWRARVIPVKDQRYINTHRGSNWTDNERYKLEKSKGYYKYDKDDITKKVLELGYSSDDPEFAEYFEYFKKQDLAHKEIRKKNDKKYWKEFGHGYVSEPTEVRGRLGEIRFNAQKEGIYDPFTEQITPEIFQNYINKERDSENWQPMKPILELREDFTDEEIIEMLNTISKNEETSDVLDDQYAQLGGDVEAWPPKWMRRLKNHDAYGNLYTDYGKWLDHTSGYGPKFGAEFTLPAKETVWKLSGDIGYNMQKDDPGLAASINAENYGAFFGGQNRVNALTKLSLFTEGADKGFRFKVGPNINILKPRSYPKDQLKRGKAAVSLWPYFGAGYQQEVNPEIGEGFDDSPWTYGSTYWTGGLQGKLDWKPRFKSGIKPIISLEAGASADLINKNQDLSGIRPMFDWYGKVGVKVPIGEVKRNMPNIDLSFDKIREKDPKPKPINKNKKVEVQESSRHPRWLKDGGYTLEEMHEGGEPHAHPHAETHQERWDREWLQSRDQDNTRHVVNERPALNLDGSMYDDSDYKDWVRNTQSVGPNPNKSWLTHAYEGIVGIPKLLTETIPNYVVDTAENVYDQWNKTSILPSNISEDLDDLYHLPANLLAEDYSSYPTRDEAFAQARADGEKDFMYKGKRYNTRREDDDIKLVYETDDPDEQFVFKYLVDETKQDYPILWNLMNKASGIDEISFDGAGSRWISKYLGKAMQNKNRAYYTQGFGFGDGATIHAGEYPFEAGNNLEFINGLIAELAHRTESQPSNNPLHNIAHNFKSAYDYIKYGDEKRYQTPGTDEFNSHRLVEPGIHMTVHGQMTPTIVKKVQNFLGLEEDGIFGEDTYLAMVDRFKDNQLIKESLEEYAKEYKSDQHPELPIHFGESALWADYLKVLSPHVPELSKSMSSWWPFTITAANTDKIDQPIPFTKESFKNRKITDFDIRQLQTFLAQQGYKLPNSLQYVSEIYGPHYDGIVGDETKAAFNDYRKKLGYKKLGGSIELGDEVDEATMKRLKKLGYTFKEM